MASFSTSDGVRLHYTDQGEGQPLVFAAGWAMDGSWWRHQEALASRYRVIVLDPRAQGRSEKTLRGMRLGRQAKDLLELLDLLELEDVVHVAWSRSSSIALAYWELFGAHRLAGYVLIGITPCMAERPDWHWGYTIDPVQFQREIIADHERVVRGVVDAVLHVRPADNIVEEMVATTMQSPPIAGARMLEDHGVIDWRDMLETVSLPTLVCVGRHDKNAPPEAAEYVSRVLPDARLVTFEHSAHAPFFEEPDLFNRHLTEFVSMLETSASPGDHA